MLTKKRNIIIVECRSTGINYIEDLINRGYNPVVLEVHYGDSEVSQQYHELSVSEYEGIKYDFDMIYEQDTYEATLNEVKKWDPLLVLPGNEGGVVLASKLAHDLGLICNPIENLDAMTLKNEMQAKIAEHGLRSIRGKVIKSTEEAIEFYDSAQLSQVVVKPTYSAGSVSVRICKNKQEMIDAVEELFDMTNLFGSDNTELLVQERIIGDEYIVNTVSCKGRHRVTLVWKYNKIVTSDGANVYDTCETVNELNIGEAEMIEYAYDVADALGIEYGPVHGEYMIDENGPVLIEVNCRPCGGHMSAKFLDKISGQHETDSILDAYLNPERFEEKLKNKYELYEYGALKFFIVPDDILAKSAPVRNISINLKSHVQTSMSDFDENDAKMFFKTQDVDSSCGIVYMAHKDYSEIHKDINFLRNVEKHSFSLILNEETHKPEVDIDLEFIEKIVKTADKYGTGLFITDQLIKSDILQISLDEMSDVGGEFDYIIINLNESLVEKSTDDIVKILLECFSMTKNGGMIVIPHTTYNLLDTGRRSMEALLRVLNFKIELPPHGVKNYIVASKR